MTRQLTDADLEAYVEESLSASAMAELESVLRAQPALLQRLASLIARRDAGVHTLAEIWRRHRISCPTREQLGSYLLGVLDDATLAYVQFHLETVGCRYCEANLEDLRQRQEADRETVVRRQRYFQSSVGRLRRPGKR
jgi:hypothetical protein